MDHTAVEQILSLLAFVGLVGVALTWIGALAERLGVGRLGSGIAGTVDGAEVWLAWLVALVAVSGSLYFSESVGYIPCVLCWYQRIAMYPFVVLLLVAIVRRERVIAPYALFLAASGLAVSIYHYQLEWFPDQASICSTTATVPCHVVWFKHFGVSTIPFLAGSGFLMIGTLMAIAWRNDRRALAADADGGDDDDRVGSAVVGEADETTTPREGDADSSRGLLLGAVALIAVTLAGSVVAFAALGDDDDAAPTSTETRTTIPLAGDPVNGKVVFAATGCGGCHSLTAAGASGKAGPSLDATSLSEAQIAAVIAGGQGAMPGYSGDLSPQEIADLAAFVHAGES